MFQAVLEKQSYMLIGRHDIEKLMRLDPVSACLQSTLHQSAVRNSGSHSEVVDVEAELSELFLSLRPIKQVCISLHQINVGKSYLFEPEKGYMCRPF